MRDDLTDLYRRWIDEAWSGDKAATREIVTDDFVGHWPDRDIHGPDALVDAIAAGFARFPDMKVWTVLGPFIDGDVVVGRWEGSASNSEGGRVRFAGNDILRVRDGRFAEFWVATATTMA